MGLPIDGDLAVFKIPDVVSLLDEHNCELYVTHSGTGPNHCAQEWLETTYIDARRGRAFAIPLYVWGKVYWVGNT